MKQLPEETIWTGTPSQWINLQVFTFTVVMLGAIVAVVVITANAWILLLALYPLFRSAFAWFKTKGQTYKLTSQRLVHSLGGVGHRTSEVSLDKVSKVELLKSWYGGMLGIGSIELTLIQSAERSFQITSIAHAKDVSEQIRKAIDALKVTEEPPVPPISEISQPDSTPVAQYGHAEVAADGTADGTADRTVDKTEESDVVW